MNPPGTEILGPISKFKKRNKISSLLVDVLHETRNWAFSRRSRAKTGKKMYKKSVMHVQSCCFAYKNLLFFWRSRCHPRRWILTSLMTRVHARRPLLGTTAATATIKTWIRAASCPNINKLIASRLLCQMFLALNSKGLYQSLRKEKQVVVLCSRSRQNVNLGTFTLYRATMAKKCTTKGWCTCKIVVLLI